MTLRTIIIAAALALPLSAAPASAQFLTFVSAAGNDANTCFVQAAPCKTLQRAINQTSAGGAVRLLTSLTSNGFINKSITIEGGQNTVIGTIAVNSASAIVRFRRLNLNGRHAFPTGLNLINAAAVHIEECSVERYTGNGINLAANVSTELTVTNSVSRDNGGRGLEAEFPSTAAVSIENSRFENNPVAGVDLSGNASVSRSVAFGNGNFGFIGGPASITESIAAANQTGFRIDADSTLESCLASGNSSGLQVTSLARISNSVFSENRDFGIETDSIGATTLTLLNNLVSGNGLSNVDGTLTPLAPE
jgi:hypothetical protein